MEKIQVLERQARESRDALEQLKISREQIDKNIRIMRWKIG